MNNRSSFGMIFRQRRWLKALAGLMGAAVCSSVHAETAKPILVLASLQPPFMDMQDDVPKGLAIDITKALFERAKTDYIIKFMPPKRAYITALGDPNTCVLGAERSQEREALFQWVSPILITRHAFYSNPDSNIQLRTLEDARPYLIGSYLGSGVGEYLESWGFRVEYAGRNDLNALKLQRKRIQLWASDTVSEGLINQELKLGISHPTLVFLTTLQSMACHVDMSKEVIKHLQHTLVDLYHDGTVKQLYDAYQEGSADWLK